MSAAKSVLEALAGASPAPDDAWARLYGARALAPAGSRGLARAPASRFSPSLYRTLAVAPLSRCMLHQRSAEALGEWDALEDVRAHGCVPVEACARDDAGGAARARDARGRALSSLSLPPRR